MHIEHINYSLMDYITGHVDKVEHSRIESHLLVCAECQKTYQELLASDAAIRHVSTESPDPVYFTNILPRVRERITTRQNPFREYSIALSRIVLPLAVSLFMIILLTIIPGVPTLELGQTEALRQTVKDLSADEVVQAITNTYAHSTVLQNQDIAASIVVEKITGDRFIAEEIVKQIESDAVSDVVVEGMISDLNREQVDQLLSGLSERTLL